MIKNIYAVKTEEELTELQKIVHKMWPELEQFLSFLKEKYRTVDLPRCIIWTDYETAACSISDLPLPAYTNDFRTVMVPDVDVWKKLYLRQLESYEENEKTAKVRAYYETLTNRNVLQIIGHEMAHHSDLFLDDAYEEAMWFEEGMVEYISRKYFLTEAEFEAEEEMNGLLVELYQTKNGISDLNDFSASTYQKDIAGVLYAYWRSYLAVRKLVDAHKGDTAAVFASYHRWFESGRTQPLTAWFENEGKNMMPTREEAEKLLKEAELSNPGPWGDHSRVAAHCAEKIAAACGCLDPDTAYILGLLHDIGRKFGVRHLGHVSDGYSYMRSLGYDKAAQICLTHSFNNQTIDEYIGKFDTTEEELAMITSALASVTMDDYDRLIQLCDALAGSTGVLNIEERMNDVKRRYGSYPKAKWDANIQLKSYFESKAGKSIYEIVEKDIYRP